MSTSPQALYRFFDEAGDLLYVGVTADLGGRWKAHSKDKPWWSDVRSCTVEPHPDRAAVLAAERSAIESERPRYNVVHNGRRKNRRAARVMADAWFGRVPTADTMPDLCHDYCEREQSLSSPICLPYRWVKGLAYYSCPRGHRWTCSWGHDRSGFAPENCNHAWVEPDDYGRLACCDCDHLLYFDDRKATA